MDNMMEQIEELSKYSELDGSEWGETMQALIQLAQYRDYISEELQVLLAKEVSDSLAYVKENCTIVETEETFKRTVRELDWS